MSFITNVSDCGNSTHTFNKVHTNYLTDNTVTVKVADICTGVHAWATAKAYKQYELIYHDGKVYIALSEHTSGEFATDLADGKLAEVSGSSVGVVDWHTNTEYKKNQLTYVNGDLYICLENHTSAVFDDDVLADKWAVIAGSSGGGGSNYSQLTKSKITAPLDVTLTITDAKYCNPPAEILKLESGAPNVNEVVHTFTAEEDAFNFNNKYVEFKEGVIQEITDFKYVFTSPSTFEGGFYSETEEIDFSGYKKIAKLEVENYDAE